VDPNESTPSALTPATLTVAQCVSKDPGCSIHERIARLAKLIPDSLKARLDKIWPRNERKVITNVNSIILAKNAVSNAAEEGEKDPRFDMMKP
jgi:hypothetical protein